MRQLNLLPIENFLEKSRLAIRSNQKQLIIPIHEVIDLQNSISIVLSRLLSKDDNKVIDKIEIKMDGGKF